MECTTFSALTGVTYPLRYSKGEGEGGEGIRKGQRKGAMI